MVSHRAVPFKAIFVLEVNVLPRSNCTSSNNTKVSQAWIFEKKPRQGKKLG
jgi:hypothetical protein